MSFKSAFRTRAVATLLSDRRQTGRRWAAELKRRMSGQPHTVSVFLQLDDPYSYLLSIYLPAVAETFDVDIRLFLTQSLGGEYAPASALLAEYAVQDCRLVARELGVPFLDRGATPVVEHRRALGARLAAEQGGDDFEEALCEALAAYWRGDVAAVSRMIAGGRSDDAAKELIAGNQERLESLGHYSTAMMHYGGEWYWGIDRLSHLLRRLEDMKLARDERGQPAYAAIGQARQLALPATAPGSARDLPPVEFFFSFRSPYSYIAMQRAFEICDAYGVRVELLPLMPMVNRGVPLPRNKLLYILADAKREARDCGVPFERFCDPIGAGIDRCLAAFHYASTERRGREFMLAAGAAIWNEGIDLATDAGLRSVTERAGLFWPDVGAALQNDDWRERVAANAEELANMGLWGVPAFRFGDSVLWGQDRLWLLARLIEDRCHDGEGIVV